MTSIKKVGNRDRKSKRRKNGMLISGKVAVHSQEEQKKRADKVRAERLRRLRLKKEEEQEQEVPV
jgi:hypothetical protein